ncbi:ABC transporter substrate-binding protein [Pseudonocardia xinjiangensis]|uniref:ABC transporter substrate-binding protein n=1 Tax=Pseudonocardia xinjiangensis TaxID=75289 RepID=UPI003D8FC706
METLDLAYVGRGIHEELVAYIADQEGYFQDEGVHVALRDGGAWDIERLRRGATIGLGRSMLSRLTDGIPWTGLSVSTHRPLFWFLARGPLESLQDLKGSRLAVHAPGTAPGCFARIVLRRNGIDPDNDLECQYRSPGDYGMHLRRLRAGEIDAALVGSTMAPEQVAEQEGWRVLAWVGDHFQIPTVGVMVDPTYVPLDSPALHAVVRANRRALRTIHERPDTVVGHVRSFMGRHTDEEIRAHLDRFVTPYFTRDGQVDLEIGDAAIAAVAHELGVPASFRAADVYRTDLVPVGHDA